MKRVVIWGAGGLGNVVYNIVKKDQEVLCFVDNNPDNCYPPPAGLKIKPPESLRSMRFDTIYIASVAGANSICKQLKNEFLIQEEKISGEFAKGEIVEEFILSPRIRFLEQFSAFARKKNINGSLAEVGVAKGNFAKEINRSFPERRLYLFDTFEGFDERDFAAENENNPRYSQIEDMMDTFQNSRNTSVSLVLDKAPYPEMCVIKKGYFPETFDIVGEQFAFVNLDTDLYAPTKAGLERFFPLMANGGIILVHDYFGGATIGARKAVDEFLAENKAHTVPLGDYSSIIILCSQVYALDEN